MLTLKYVFWKEILFGNEIHNSEMSFLSIGPVCVFNTDGESHSSGMRMIMTGGNDPSLDLVLWEGNWENDWLRSRRYQR